MARAKGSGVKTRRRHKKWIKRAKGANQRRGSIFKAVKETVMKGLEYAFVGRKLKKREYRRLWIARINAAVRQHDISYSRFMAGLKKHQIDIDRKVLADLAINDPSAIAKLVEVAKT